MKDLIYSAGKNDECYTPSYGVHPIVKHIELYIKKNNLNNLVVWCPFDKEESNFVNIISCIDNVEVIYSHIDNGQDFYTYEPNQHWDIIISNPPFTNKRKIFERALSFEKPFALIMTNTWLNDSAPKQLFKDKELQLLMFDKRMKFNSPDGRDNNKITFSSSYYCWNFLSKQIVMEELC